MNPHMHIPMRPPPFFYWPGKSQALTPACGLRHGQSAKHDQTSRARLKRGSATTSRDKYSSQNTTTRKLRERKKGRKVTSRSRRRYLSASRISPWRWRKGMKKLIIPGTLSWRVYILPSLIGCFVPVYLLHQVWNVEPSHSSLNWFSSLASI